MSITNFESWTPEFNPKYKPVVVWIENYFLSRRSLKSITGPKLVAVIGQELGVKLHEVELRTCIRETRFRGQVPIEGGGKGYKLIMTDADLDNQIRSLEERAQACNYAATCLRNYDRTKLLGNQDLFQNLFG